jgi:hypothetical protein
MTSSESHPWFGQDPTDIDAVLAFWEAHANIHRNVYWYALVDSAFDHGAQPDLPGAFNCYEGERVIGLSEVSPLLVPLGLKTTGKEVLARLLVHCSGRPMLSLLASAGTAQKLATSWRAMYWAHLPESQKMLLRFADTRVLSELPAILRADQWQCFTAPIATWIFIDRTGAPSLLPKAAPSAATAQKLELDQKQLDALVSRSQADAVLDYMRREMPDVISVMPCPSQTYVHLARACRQAATHRIERLADIAVLALATLGLDAHDPVLAAIEDLLRTKAWVAGNLAQALSDRKII